jgi:hypothetical protein
MTSFAIVEILVDLVRLGIRVEAEGERLRITPQSAMTPELRARLARHKPALVQLLSACAAEERGPTTGCWNCRKREFHRVEGQPEWMCSYCYPPRNPEAVIARWTAPEQSLSPTAASPARLREAALSEDTSLRRSLP